MHPLADMDKTKVLIVGDVMLDRYWWGSVGRISPEAPVPVVRLTKSTISAGGAANVAANVAGLGAKPLLLGIVGIDEEGEAVRQTLSTLGVDTAHLVAVEGRPTTVKTRVIAHSQQVVRIDQESDDAVPAEIEAMITERFRSLIDEADTVIVSDYAKGLLTERILSDLINIARNVGKAILVDPKGKDYSRYRGASLITPNRREAAEACKLDDNNPSVVEKAGTLLIRELDVECILITQGEEGMTLFRQNREPKHFPTTAREVYDVTGAGDTVIATLGTALGAGRELETATQIANTAAGIVVEQIGTTAINIGDLNDAMSGLREAAP